MVYHGGVNELPPDLDENAPPDASLDSPVKRAVILYEDDDSFAVEYDNTIGTRNTMRLEATIYEDAILEIKSFLGITDNRDQDGTVWEID
jgi:hypothetical protein